MAASASPTAVRSSTRCYSAPGSSALCGNFDIIFGGHFSAKHHATPHLPCAVLYRVPTHAHGYWRLIGACNPMACPINIDFRSATFAAVHRGTILVF